MSFTLKKTERFAADYLALSLDTTKAGKAAFKAVKKAIAYLAANPKHPSLNTHEYDSLEGASGERVWEAYAQSDIPCAWRVFWHDGPERGEITLVAVTAHP